MVSRVAMRGPAPVHLWNPPYCGEIDMRIGADGTWYHEGTPIGRPAMVALFASILVREEDGRYFLVTPIEKVGIRVDDAPFAAVAMDVENRGGPDQALTFVTNVGERVRVGPENALWFEVDDVNEGLRPYLHVRSGLNALLTRALTYDLIDLAETREIDGVEWMGVASEGEFFRIASMADAGG